MMRFFIFAVGMAASVQLNPVTRVVQLMEGLVKKCKADGEAEQELYDKFKCWCKKVINAKTTTMAANEARIDELAQYIDDLESGRIELTSERTDLEARLRASRKPSRRRRRCARRSTRTSSRLRTRWTRPSQR
jgi:hypothetical protein